MQSIANEERRVVLRSEYEWERVVLAEVIVPGTPNVYGDYWTVDKVREAAYLYAKHGYVVDYEHDNVSLDEKVSVVEYFIARAGDPVFIEGSWVVGVQVHDDALWQKVLDGDVNGFSYEAVVSYIEGILRVDGDMSRQGVTEPDPEDGHVHDFAVIVDEDNRPVEGGTTVVNGHYHTISVSTHTDEADGHRHRYNLVKGKDGV